MKLILAVLAFVVISHGGDKEEKEKRDLVTQYLLNEGVRKSSEYFFDKQIMDLRSDFPELSDSIWEDVRKNVHEGEALLEGIIEMHMGQFSLAELREIKKAMENPAFKKYKDYMESKESQKDFGMLAMRTGRVVSLRITEYLKKKKYIEEKK